MTNIEAILSKVPGTKLDVKYFATIEEARAWLQRPGPTPRPSWKQSRTSKGGELSTYSAGDVHMDERWLFIGWDRACRCVYAEFKAFATSAEFREGTAKILDVIREKYAIALVSDNRRLEGVAPHDQLWIRDTWVPMAVAAGLTRIAVVVAHSGLGKIASEEIFAQIGAATFATCTFDSLPAAMSWAGGEAGLNPSQ